MRLAETVEDGLVAEDETVAADDFFSFWIPQDQLLVAVGRIGIKLVQVHFLAGTAATVAEGDFPKPADFPDDIRCILVGHDIQFVAGTVGLPEQGVRIQFGLEQGLVDRVNDLLHGYRFSASK